VSAAYTLQVGHQAGGVASVQATHEITPATGLSLVTDLSAAGYTTNQSSQTFLVQDQFTANEPGDYTVKLSGTLTAGNASDQASDTMLVHVLPANGAGLLTLNAFPGGLQTGSSAALTFGATYTLGAGAAPAVRLVEVNADGTPVQEQGAMRDDGTEPDLAAGDSLFSNRSMLTAGAAGSRRYFKAVATLASGSEVASSTLAIPSLPFPIGFAPVNPAATVTDPATGAMLQCDQVLVQFKPEATLAGVTATVALVNGQVLGVEPQLNTYQVGIACDGMAGVQAAINTLQQQSLVAVAGPNGVASLGEFTPNDASYASTYAPGLVRADEAWLIARGKNMVVAVLDSGVDYNHPDLIGRVVKGKDYINGDNDPQDDHSHGTHVAGIIAAKGNNAIGIAGMAWDAKILAIKVCGGKAGVPAVGALGGCPDSAVTSGILEAASKARIINMSLSGPVLTLESIMNAVGLQTARQKAVNAAVAGGVMVVAASGNDNTSSTRLPCAYAGVFCVGNTTSADVRYTHPSTGSNYGAQVDIAAPGTGILSTVPIFSNASGYGIKTGTSMASPLVAGVAALVWGNNPSWTRAQLEDRLLRTAVQLPGQQVGPRVDAFDAVFNGSFESDLSGWKTSGTGSVVTKLGPINPTKDLRMGMVSTGPDAAVATSDLYQEFTIQPGVNEFAISFSYAMITEEFPEWVNRGFNDDFRVTLEAQNGTEHELVLETVDSSAFSMIGGIDFPGGDQTTGWTGWRHIVSKKVPVTPGAGVYRLRVRDRGDGIYDTNGIMDNIRFK
jgi:subtilisin family serine protease